MKPLHLLPPAIALIASGLWLSSQNTTIRELTEKTTFIQERITLTEQARTSAAATVSLTPSATPESDPFTLPDGSIHWQAVAEMLAEAQGKNGIGMPSDMTAMFKIQQRILELTEDEITQGLAALTTLGYPITSQSDTLFWVQRQALTTLAQSDAPAELARKHEFATE